MASQRRVLVTGGAGYVGSALVPKLLAAGWRVRVLDLYLYRRDVFAELAPIGALEEIVGDMRDRATLERAVAGCDAAIHLACISNDPSFELNPTLGKSINFDCFPLHVDAAKAAGVRRFVYASSSSVYGVKAEAEVTEDLALTPLTDYSKYKALCEEILASRRGPGFETVVLRPATVCGYAPRQRLDVIVNILAAHAVHNGRIRVLGGAQTRPNIHVEDMADLYVRMLDEPAESVDGQVFNAGRDNLRVDEIARIVAETVGGDVGVAVEPTDDPRSYRVSSERLAERVGFRATRTIADAVRDLVAAFADGRLPDAMTDPTYYNIKRMQEVALR